MYMMCTGAYTYTTLQHSPKGVLHIYQYITVSAYGTYKFCDSMSKRITSLQVKGLG
jgi:hypothetical protein